MIVDRITIVDAGSPDDPAPVAIVEGRDEKDYRTPLRLVVPPEEDWFMAALDNLVSEYIETTGNEPTVNTEEEEEEEEDGERKAEKEAERYIRTIDEDYDRTHQYDRWG